MQYSLLLLHILLTHKCLCIRNMNVQAWVVLMESVNVCYQRVPRLAKLLAVLAVVTRVVKVLALHMVVQV